jgi:hypothetical protein
MAVTAAQSPKHVRFNSSHNMEGNDEHSPKQEPLKDELRYNELDCGLVMIATIAVLIAMPIPCWTILFLLNP